MSRHPWILQMASWGAAALCLGTTGLSYSQARAGLGLV